MAATPIAGSPTGGNDDAAVPGGTGACCRTADSCGTGDCCGTGDSCGTADSCGGLTDSSVPCGLPLRAGVEEAVEVFVGSEFAVPDEREDFGPARGVAREQADLGQIEVLELVGLGVDSGLRLGEGDRIVEAVRVPKRYPLLVDEPLAAW